MTRAGAAFFVLAGFGSFLSHEVLALALERRKQAPFSISNPSGGISNGHVITSAGGPVPTYNVPDAQTSGHMITQFGQLPLAEGLASMSPALGATSHVAVANSETQAITPSPVLAITPTSPSNIASSSGGFTNGHVITYAGGPVPSSNVANTQTMAITPSPAIVMTPTSPSNVASSLGGLSDGHVITYAGGPVPSSNLANAQTSGYVITQVGQQPLAEGSAYASADRGATLPVTVADSETHVVTPSPAIAITPTSPSNVASSLGGFTNGHVITMEGNPPVAATTMVNAQLGGHVITQVGEQAPVNDMQVVPAPLSTVAGSTTGSAQGGHMITQVGQQAPTYTVGAEAGVAASAASAPTLPVASATSESHIVAPTPASATSDLAVSPSSMASPSGAFNNGHIITYMGGAPPVPALALPIAQNSGHLITQAGQPATPISASAATGSSLANAQTIHTITQLGQAAPRPTLVGEAPSAAAVIGAKLPVDAITSGDMIVATPALVAAPLAASPSSGASPSFGIANEHIITSVGAPPVVTSTMASAQTSGHMITQVGQQAPPVSGSAASGSPVANAQTGHVITQVGQQAPASPASVDAAAPAFVVAPAATPAAVYAATTSPSASTGSAPVAAWSASNIDSSLGAGHTVTYVGAPPVSQSATPAMVASGHVITGIGAPTVAMMNSQASGHVITQLGQSEA